MTSHDLIGPLILTIHNHHHCLQTSGESPPAPTRGPNVRGEEEEEEGGDEGEGGGAAPAAAVSLADLMPKVDISGQLKSELIRELGDKNWKIRGEALQKVGLAL